MAAVKNRVTRGVTGLARGIGEGFGMMKKFVTSQNPFLAPTHTKTTMGLTNKLKSRRSNVRGAHSSVRNYRYNINTATPTPRKKTKMLPFRNKSYFDFFKENMNSFKSVKNLDEFVKVIVIKNRENPNWLSDFLPIQYLELYSSNDFLHDLERFGMVNEPVTEDTSNLFTMWSIFLEHLKDLGEYMTHDMPNYSYKDFFNDAQIKFIITFCKKWLSKFTRIMDYSHHYNQLSNTIDSLERRMNEILEKRQTPNISRSGLHSTYRRSTNGYEESKESDYRESKHRNDRSLRTQNARTRNARALNTRSRNAKTLKLNIHAENNSFNENKNGREMIKDIQNRINSERKKHIKNIREAYAITDYFNKKTDDPEVSLARLVDIFHLEIDNIITELRINQKKIGHWAWWIFPTEQSGSSDKIHTYVTAKTSNSFLNSIDIEKWKTCINLVIDILKIDKSSLHNDIGRIENFCNFWSDARNVKKLDAPKLKWLPVYCSKLINAINDIENI